MVGAVKTKVKQVLGSPLTVSTRRVELTTFKEMVLEEVPMLAKSWSEEGSQNLIPPRVGCSLRTLSITQEHSFLRGVNK